MSVVLALLVFSCSNMLLQIQGLLIPPPHQIRSSTRMFQRRCELRHGRHQHLRFNGDKQQCMVVSKAISIANTDDNPRDKSLYLPSDPLRRPVTAAMAPMVSASDYAFRCLVRQYAISECTKPISSTSSAGSSSSSSGIGCDYNVPLAFTQMLHAHNLIRDEPYFRNHFDMYEYRDDIDSIQRDLTESQRNAYNDQNYPNIGRCYEAPCTLATRGPVIAQLAGHDVSTVVKAAQKIVASTNGRIAGIDLNLGCPQNIARKGNYGAYLMENHPAQACSILKALRESLPHTVTVSAKIRLPYDPTLQNVRLRQLCDTGVSFITVHGRDYTENKTTVKHIQLPRLIEAVQTIRDYSHDQIPVIVNGGIEFVADAIQIQQQTGAAAVMSSEALLEQPNILGAIQRQQHRLHRQDLLHAVLDDTVVASYDTINSPRQQFHNQIQCSLDYLKWCYYVPPLSSGLGLKGGSFNVVRGHLFKMLYRYFNDPMNYDLRDQLGDSYIMQRLDQAEILVKTLRQRYELLKDADWDLLGSSRFLELTWYRRHRSSSVLVHGFMKPNAHFNSNGNTQELQKQEVENTLTLVERKIMIRTKIELLRNQKKTIIKAFDSK